MTAGAPNPTPVPTHKVGDSITVPCVPVFRTTIREVTVVTKDVKYPHVTYRVDVSEALIEAASLHGVTRDASEQATMWVNEFETS